MVAEPMDRLDGQTPVLASVRLTPDQIEKLRQTGIRLDRLGRFWHEGTRVTHAGLARALLRWLDRLPDGRPILRLDEQRYAYVEVEDAHLLVLAARWQGDRVTLTLNDGTEEELLYDSLTVADDHALYCRVRSGTLDARVTTPAYYALAERIDAVAPGDPLQADTAVRRDESVFALRACGTRFVIGQRDS